MTLDPTDDAPDTARKFALVTGASSGIGRAIAIALGCASFAVIITARRKDALAETAAQVSPPESCVATIPCDLHNPTAIDDLAHRVAEITGGKLAVLVNCAGVYHRAPFEATPPEVMDDLYMLNFRAPYQLSQRLLPQLRAGQGMVVFVNSTAALNPSANVSAYSASKAALKALADTMRDEYAAEDLRVLSIFPGRTDTPMGHRVFALEGREIDPELLVQPEDVAAAIVAAVMLPLRAQVTNLQVGPGRQHGAAARPANATVAT